VAERALASYDEKAEEAMRALCRDTLYQMWFNLKLSGNEVDHTIFLIFPVKIMLCSKLHCRICFILQHISYRIGISLPKNQRQHRTLHIQTDVLPYALC